MSEPNKDAVSPVSPLEELDLDLEALGVAPEQPGAQHGAREEARPTPRRAPSAMRSAPTHFAESVGRSGPAFDSEPPGAPDDWEDSPLELPAPPAPRGPASPLEHLLRKSIRGVGARVSELGRQFATASRTLLAERAAARRPGPARDRTTRRPAAHRKPRGGLLRYREPVLGVLTIALVYGVTTTALGTAPWSSSGPRVPNLGGPTEGTRTTSLPEQRDFRTTGDAKPGAAPTATEAAGPGAASAPTAAPGPFVETTALPSDLSFPGKSVLEVVTAEDELIYVDGVFLGRGPLRRIPVAPGVHVVSIRSGGSERKGTLDAAAGRLVRASFIDGAAFAAVSP